MFISTNASKGKHIWIWTTRRCRKWKKGNKILVSLKKTHMIWHIRRFGKWKKGLFGFSTFRNSIWSIFTFQLFEIQYEACPLFNVSTFRLFEIENETLPLFDFSTFRNWQWSLSTFQFFDFSIFLTYLPTETMQRIFPTQRKPPYVQWSKDAMKGFNYDPPSLLKTCDLLCVAIGGLV